MHGPASPGWLLVALCAASGAYCLLRMRSPVEEQRRTAGAEALMGFGMAAMAVPAAAATPPRWAWFAYAAVFGAAALRALWSVRSSPHHLHHLVGACAMVYMAAAMAASPGHHGHGGGSRDSSGHGGAPDLLRRVRAALRGARLLPVAAVAGELGDARRRPPAPRLGRPPRAVTGVPSVHGDRDAGHAGHALSAAPAPAT